MCEVLQYCLNMRRRLRGRMRINSLVHLSITKDCARFSGQTARSFDSGARDSVFVPPSVDVDADEEDEEDDEERAPVEPEDNAPVVPAQRRRVLVEDGRQDHADQQHDEGAREEANLQ